MRHCRLPVGHACTCDGPRPNISLYVDVSVSTALCSVSTASCMLNVHCFVARPTGPTYRSMNVKLNVYTCVIVHFFKVITRALSN